MRGLGPNRRVDARGSGELVAARDFFYQVPLRVCARNERIKNPPQVGQEPAKGGIPGGLPPHTLFSVPRTLLGINPYFGGFFRILFLTLSHSSRNRRRGLPTRRGRARFVRR